MPDAVNRPEFTSIIVEPGQEYVHSYLLPLLDPMSDQVSLTGFQEVV